jgi:hypothetical protein
MQIVERTGFPESSPAPFESCIGCSKGDTTTIVQLRGQAEWLIAGLVHLAGISKAEAEAIVLIWAEERGYAPGTIPPGWRDYAFRLCRDCAHGTGAVVGKAGEAGPVYTQAALRR